MMADDRAVAPNSRYLTCKQEIRAYMGHISDYMFKKYVEAGLPARFEDGRWSASTANIDRWWDAYTMVSMRSVINTIPDTAD